MHVVLIFCKLIIGQVSILIFVLLGSLVGAGVFFLIRTLYFGRVPTEITLLISQYSICFFSVFPICLFIGLLGNIEITPKENKSIKIRNLFFISSWKNILIRSLIGGLVLIIVIHLLGFFIATIYTLTMNPNYFFTYSISPYIDMFFILGFIGSFISTLIQTLTLSNIYFFTKTSYGRYINDFSLKILQYIIVAPLAMIFTMYFFEYPIVKTLEENNIEPLYFVLMFIFFGGLIGLLNTAFFKHLILRLCLFLEKKLPLQLVHFLQYATEARILEQDGGQWRFRHQILQDYFAERYRA